MFLYFTKTYKYLSLLHKIYLAILFYCSTNGTVEEEQHNYLRAVFEKYHNNFCLDSSLDILRLVHRIKHIIFYRLFI